MTILAIVLYLFPQAIGYVFPLIAGVIAIFIVLRMSRSASEAGLRLALVLPLLIGITVSWMTGQFLFAVLGVAIPAVGESVYPSSP